MSTQTMDPIAALAKTAAIETLRASDPVVKFAADNNVPEGYINYLADVFAVSREGLVKAAADDAEGFAGFVEILEKAGEAGIAPQDLAAKLVPTVRGCHTLSQAMQKVAGARWRKPEHLGQVAERVGVKMPFAGGPLPSGVKDAVGAALSKGPATSLHGGYQAKALGGAHGDPNQGIMDILRNGRNAGGMAGQLAAQSGAPSGSILQRGADLANRNPAAAIAGAGALGGAGIAGGIGAAKAMSSPQQPPAAQPGVQPHGMETGRLGSLLAKLRANPGKAALMGIGGAAGAYGLKKLVGGGGKKKPKNEKEASDRKAEFLKRAADVRRHNATIIFTRYLEKVAADLPPRQQKAFARVQASLVLGNNINQAMRKGFPKMAVEKRVLLADRLVKRAMAHFLKQACFPGCKTQQHKSFHGKPKDGHAWMKENS